MVGNIPAELGNLINLTVLHVPYNALKGEVPLSLTELVNLEWGPITYNSLSSADPTVIAFLDTVDQECWAHTQTISPTDLQASALPFTMSN